MTSEQLALVAEHESLVVKVAGPSLKKMDRRRNQDKDLLQAGRLGLVDAARRWDPTKNVPFGAYARLRIHGSIIDMLRNSQHVTGSQKIYKKPFTTVQFEHMKGWNPTHTPETERTLDAEQVMKLTEKLEPERRRTIRDWAKGVPLADTAAELKVPVHRVSYLNRLALRELKEMVYGK
jgi:RNA polymerase sigma factor (sigma-70 family)